MSVTFPARAPSVERLREFVGNARLDVIPGVDTVDKVAEEIRRILKLPHMAKELWNYPGVVELRKTCHRSPSRAQVKLTAINQLVGGCGIEYLTTKNTDEEAMYINTGEMYALTLIHFRGKFSYTSLFSFVQHGPAFN